MGGGSGFRGLHGQPDDGAVVDDDAGGAAGGGAWFVTAGGGVVFFGVCTGLWGALVVLCGASLVAGAISVWLGAEFVVDWTHVDAGGLLCGSSVFAPWIAMPTSTPSSADPNTAEPPAAHSARTAVLLKCSRGEVRRSRSRQITGLPGRGRTFA